MTMPHYKNMVKVAVSYSLFYWNEIHLFIRLGQMQSNFLVTFHE